MNVLEVLAYDIHTIPLLVRVDKLLLDGHSSPRLHSSPHCCRSLCSATIAIDGSTDTSSCTTTPFITTPRKVSSLPHRLNTVWLGDVFFFRNAQNKNDGPRLFSGSSSV